jgi:hypothetical protein
MRADFTPIFYACHPNAHANTPIASDFTTKMNDWSSACSNLYACAAIVKNRAEIGSSRTKIGLNRLAIVRMRAHIVPGRVESGHIVQYCQKEKSMRARQPCHPQTDIPLPLAVWHQLIDASVKGGYQKEDWEIATEAIDQWVRRQNPDAIPMPAATGYQWKEQFLPAGTLLRTVFGGKNYHCMVEGDQILYDGKPVSPSGFVNAVGGIRRNAWRCTWILFPDSKDWKLADTLRTRERPHRARKPARCVQQTPAAPAAPRAPADFLPAANPLPRRIEPIAASESAPSDLRHAIDNPEPRTNANGERRHLQQHTGINLSPPGNTCGMGRRTNGDDGLAALLRQQLLPLLYRMCAFEAMAPESRTSRSPTMRWNPRKKSKMQRI